MCSVCLVSHVQLFVVPWTVTCQAPLSMKILQARILDWVAYPSPGYLLDPEIEPTSPVSPARQVDSLMLNHGGSPISRCVCLCAR